MVRILQDQHQQLSPSSKTSSSSTSSTVSSSSSGASSSISRSTCIFVLGIWVGICSTTLFGNSLSRTLFGPSAIDLRCYMSSSETLTYAVSSPSASSTSASKTSDACHCSCSNSNKDDDDGHHNGSNHRDNDDDGWTSIDVYYGNSSQLHVTSKNNKKDDTSSISWRSQVGQDKLIYKFITNEEAEESDKAAERSNGGGGELIVVNKNTTKRNYYFVDLAANDATFLSNTYTLETYFGWNGLCIEANPKYWSRLAYRKCQVVGAVIGNELGQEIDFSFGPSNAQQVKHFDETWSRNWDKGTLGGIVSDEFDNKPPPSITPMNNNTTETYEPRQQQQSGGTVIVKRYTVPLKYIFERYNVPKIIDYLSLDVEGAEYYIMKDFPFDTYSFRFLSIERPNEQLQEILKNNGYELLSNTRLDKRKLGETIWAMKKKKEEVAI